MEIIVGEKSYKIIKINNTDVEAIQSVFVKCRDFVILVDGNEPSDDSGEMFLSDLPAGKGLEDKFSFGIYDLDEMIGIVDLIRDYKIVGEWYLGLLIIDPKYRAKGLGTAIHNWIKTFVLDNGGSKMSLGVVANNTKAYKFWKNAGYMEIMDSERNKSGRELISLSMELK